MLTTYRASLRGNHLEWIEDTPEQARTNKSVPVFVTVLDEKLAHSGPMDRGQLMAEILERIAAARSTFNEQVPAKWEREIRRERQLPQREE